MREFGLNLGGPSYQHIQSARFLDDEAWIDHLVCVGSLRYSALKKPRWVEECLNKILPDPLKLYKGSVIIVERPLILPTIVNFSSFIRVSVWRGDSPHPGHQSNLALTL